MPLSVRFALWFGICTVMWSTKSLGQEALRLPIASEEGAAGQSLVANSNYYNAQAGPVYLRFQGEMGIELNDNVNYTATNRRLDVILRPILDTDILWPLSGHN